MVQSKDIPPAYEPPMMKVKVEPRRETEPDIALPKGLKFSTLTPFTEEEKKASQFFDAKDMLLPSGYDERKKIPIGSGVLDYFPSALIAVAEVSRMGNEQHNPGEELHWARGKSMDQFNTCIRHLMERGAFDTDGVRHSAKAAWRALALLQLELEAAGAPRARGAR